MIALSLIQVTAADHTKSLAVFPAKHLSRQAEENIIQRNFIQFNALTVCHDIIIVIVVADGRNNNMVKGKIIFSGKLFQTPVAGVKKLEYGSIIKIDYACPVIELSAETNIGTE